MTPPDRLRRYAPPRASSALRERVLAGAREAVSSSVAISRADRIWFSTGWRFAWVAAIAACALVEASVVRRTASARGQLRPVSAATREADAAAAAIGIPGAGLIGDRVVTNDETAHDGLEVPL
jgi:hypothetical protein